MEVQFAAASGDAALYDPAKASPRGGSPESRGPFPAVEDRASVLAQRRMDMLMSLAETGMEMAEGVRRQAAVLPVIESATLEQGDARQLYAAEKAICARRELALIYQRVSRAVRQTLALHAKFEDEHLTRYEKIRAAQQAADKLAANSALWRNRKLAERAVARLIETENDDAGAEGNEGADEAEVSLLREALHERLDDYEALDELDGKSVGEIIARICRDLGVEPDWSLWQDEPWAGDEAGYPPSSSSRAQRGDPGFMHKSGSPRRSAPRDDDEGDCDDDIGDPDIDDSDRDDAKPPAGETLGLHFTPHGPGPPDG
jgi:hypothetical protein